MKINEEATIDMETIFTLGTGLLLVIFTEQTLKEIGKDRMKGMADGVVMAISAIYGSAIGLYGANVSKKDAEILLDLVRAHFADIIEKQLGIIT